MHKHKLPGGVTLLLALAILSPISALAQTTVTQRASNFEIIAVDENYLVVRDHSGTRALTVPPDFRFTVDGKSLGVSELHAGMKGTAVVTTTTIQQPVYVTTVKKGTVTSQTARSIQIKDDDGKIHKFTQSEIDKRGIRLYGGDSVIPISQLNPGDKVSATIVTESAPDIITTQAVDANLAGAMSADEPIKRSATSQVKATVVAVDQATRLVTLKGPEGKTFEVVAGSAVHHLDQVQPGDVVAVTYTESLAFQVVPKGEKPQGSSESVERTKGGGEVGRVVTRSFKIDSYDPNTHVLWGTGAQGNTRSITVQDPKAQAALAKLSPGNEVQVTYSESLAIKLEKVASK